MTSLKQDLRDSLWRARELASLFKEAFFLSLVAYADESGTHDEHGLQRGSEYATVAGWLARKEHWERFTERWNDVLEEYQVPAFHLSEFDDPLGSDKPDWPYLGWDRGRCDLFIQKLITVARDNTVLGISGSVSVKDYDEVVPEWLKKDTHHPYHFSLQSFFDNILETLHDKMPHLLLPHEQVAFFFEEQEEFEKKAIELYHKVKLRDVDNRMGSITFLQKGQRYRALEAADLLAGRMRKAVGRKLKGEDPFMPGTWNAHLNAREHLVIGYFPRDAIAAMVAEVESRNQAGRKNEG